LSVSRGSRCGGGIFGEELVAGLILVDEWVVFAVERPRAARHFAEVHEFPVRDIRVGEAEEVTDGGRYVKPSALIGVWRGFFVAEDVLPVVGPERAAIAPLRVADLSRGVANFNPLIPADGLAVFNKCFLEPGDDLFGFGLEFIVGEIVVGKRDVERVLPGDKLGGKETCAMGGKRIVEPAEAADPIVIPGVGFLDAFSIMPGAHPEDGGHDPGLPGIAREVAGRPWFWDGNERFEFEELGGATLLGVGLEIRAFLRGRWAGDGSGICWRRGCARGDGCERKGCQQREGDSVRHGVTMSRRRDHGK